MINNTQLKFSKRNVVRMMSIITLLIGILTFHSYQVSKKAVETLVGETQDYFKLTRTRIVIVPIERNQLVWMFKYSIPESFDEEFYIYTNLHGEVTLTNPPDLKQRLRRFEKLEQHPYSNESKQPGSGRAMQLYIGD